MKKIIPISILAVLSGCKSKPPIISEQIIQPAIITEKVNYDSDDPAIWVNKKNPAQSLILGTDKDKDGGLFVFDLKGKIRKDLSVGGLQRPNNVDIAYGLTLNGKKTDIAVTTERLTHKLRVFSLPDMKPVDAGGIVVFEGETAPEYRDLMGIALYSAPSGEIYAIVGRKNGPADGYLWQYLLSDDGSGKVKASLVRKFGKYSGKKEIEAIAADNENGYIYYSDEQFGVRKYFADPKRGNTELGQFAKSGFSEDHEGISIYKTGAKTGYILVSDQGSNKFHIFRREGKRQDELKTVTVAAEQSDGSDMVSVPLDETFKHGLFVVMSNDRTFHLYRWEDVAGEDLKINPAKKR